MKQGNCQLPSSAFCFRNCYQQKMTVPRGKSSAALTRERGRRFLEQFFLPSGNKMKPKQLNHEKMLSKRQGTSKEEPLDSHKINFPSKSTRSFV